MANRKSKKGSILSHMGHTDLLLNLSPKSRFAESIKTIRTNLAFSEIDKSLKTILVTSPEPGDGKSFIAANLAVAYSQEGKSVLLIDADLRKGRQHEIFGVMNVTSGGYSNLILGYQDKESETKKEKEDFDVNDYIVKTGINNVDIIPNGPTPPNPVELLSSKSNSKLLSYLKKKYDVIILDCAPVLGISDTSIMTRYSDANILVISNKKTKYEILERTKKVFSQANAPITGVVMNKVSVKGVNYSGYYCDRYYGDTN